VRQSLGDGVNPSDDLIGFGHQLAQRCTIDAEEKEER